MSDPNHIALVEQKLVFMLPCKVGNSSIKAALADTLGMKRKQLHLARTWNVVSNAEISALGKDWLIVGFVRHPYARFLSAWRHKIRDEGKTALAHGASTIDGVAEALPRITDQHWRRLVDELCMGGRPLCNLVVKTDDMQAAWKTVQGAVHGHCRLLLHRIPHLNQTVGDEVLSKQAKSLIAAHYADDLKRFGYQA